MTDLLEACPGLARYLAQRHLRRSMWQPRGELELSIDDAHKIRLTLAGVRSVVVQCSVATLPPGETARARMMREALEATGALLAQLPGGLAIDPANQCLWWQDAFDCGANEHEIDAVLEQFVDAVRTICEALEHSPASSPPSLFDLRLRS
ncbi:CesT family type III secretion system chaperone [Paraburkholderia bonniea]|uniref:CesT family type III secretion system chaperone n=1 Tax=Paraburkholderia bonniea TaxID=2152891 RepID=UPI00129194C6|nr:CesT family type III secretion system chaperone [Paraburkholderia bonniea]WJF89305.1 CesT family type III secretion system chaperone [Paraburkholderia bonniea]WJF92621.1 CesT family type III secretion system chaperone [Paraburkholderia bonniea]